MYSSDKPAIKLNFVGAIYEFIGTFCLCFFGGLSVGHASASPTTPALCHGIVLGVNVYIAAKYSGGLFNPAVAFGLLITKNLDFANFLLFTLFQIAGSLVSGIVLLLTTYSARNSQITYPDLNNNVSITQGFLLEAIGSFMLMWNIYAVAVHHKSNRSVCGVVVGATLVVLVYGLGPITGAGFNPARNLGGLIMTRSYFFKHYLIENGGWVFFTAPYVGAGLAAFLYEYGLLRLIKLQN